MSFESAYQASLFAFRCLLPDAYDLRRVLSVYSFDHSGNMTFYGSGDYQVDSSLNTIRRTVDSNIPDFSNYSVELTDGLFSFSSSPRNPPFIYDYQIYVTYETETVFQPIVSSSILDDYNLDGNQKIYVYGDSIALGAQTYEELFLGDDSGSFVGLLRSFLTEQDERVSVLNKSSEGQVSAYFFSDYRDALEDGADVFLIEFGMNDHVYGEQGLDQFISNMSLAIGDILSHNRAVLLVGFFQQNKAWKKEFSHDTQAYNNALINLASEHAVPFVDIFSIYDKLASRKNIIDDLTADWMHHPNNFG